MTAAGRRIAIAAWVGFTLAALFLYPLAGALADDAFYLQWQRQDSAEALAALALLWLLFTPLAYWLWPVAGAVPTQPAASHTAPRDMRARRATLATLALLAVASLPVASFLAELLQQLPNDGALIHAWENPAIRLGIPATLLLIAVVALVLVPRALGWVIRSVLLMLSPVAVLVLYTIGSSAYYRHPAVMREAPPPRTSSTQCGSVLALLFDELSFSYLYDGDAVKADYPAIRALADGATQYMRVTAPGHETMISLPGYLAVRHFTDIKVEAGRLVTIDEHGGAAPFNARQADGLFARSRRAGFSNEMAGYYLPYCDLLGDLVDVCRSFSFYNVARIDEGFSPLDAIRTTLVLWPRQLPFGLLKNPPFARLQQGLVDHVAAFARRPLPAGGPPVFRFVHFSIPHLPFVFTADGFQPPFDPLRTAPDSAYVAQIGYVDRLVGELVARMKGDGSFERTTVIVFADHGFRFGGRETDPVHIPFIVKRAGQRARRDVFDDVRAEDLLSAEVTGACRP